MSSWDQANRGEKLGLVWRNRRKLARLSIIVLLIILCILLLTRTGEGGKVVGFEYYDSKKI
jgi:hypothetical protein